MASIVVGTLRVLLTSDSAQFEAGMRRAQQSFGEFSKSAQSIGRQATQLGASLTKTLTLPILAFGGAVVKAAIDFESSFAGVKKTVNATEAEFAIMAQSLRNLAKTIPVNVNELNRLAEAAGAMGIPKAEIVEFSRVMALLGVTTNVTSDQAAESIGKIQNIFASAGKETDRFAATLVALGNAGASFESQILEMATRIAATGNVIGLTQGQVLAFASALSDVGLEAEAGGTAISRVFVDIAASVSKGGKELAQFANVAGLSTAAFSKMFKEDAAGAVLAFIEGLGRIPGDEVLRVLAAMGIEEVRLRNALLAAAGAGDKLRNALTLQGVAWRENSALTEEARKRFETTSSQLTLLWNRVKDVAITLGNALLPMIKATVRVLDDLLPIIESVARAFVALPMPIQAAVVGFGLMLAAAPPLLWFFGQLALAVSGIAALFVKGGLAARALGVVMGPAGLAGVLTALRTAFLVLLGPWGLVAAAAVLLAPVLWDLVGGWKGITAALAPLGTALSNTWTFFKDIATIVVDLSGSILRGLWTWLKDITSQAVTLGTALLDWVLTPLRTLAEWVSKIPGLSAAWGGFVSAVVGTKDAIVGAAAATKTFLDDTRNRVHQVAESIRGADINGALQRMRAAGLEMAVSHGGVATAITSVTAALKAGEPALDKNLFQTKASTDAAEKAAAAKLKEAAAYRAFINEIGEREIEDVAANMKAREDAEAKHRQFLNQLGEQEIADFGANIATKESKEREWREFQNEQGVRIMDSEAAQLAQRTSRWTGMIESLKLAWSTLEDAITGRLGSLFFGNLGHDVTGELKAAADEAELDFLRIKRNGQATAEELSVAFERWREAEDRANFSFGERWKQFWGGLKQTFVSILDDMLGAYIKILARMAAVKFGANLTAGSVLGSVLGGGASVATGGAVAGGTAAAGAAGATAAAGAGGAGATAAGVGGGIGLGTTVALTGGVAAGVLLAWAIWKKGLFRGGEERLVNPRRDKFQLQFGGPPVSVGGNKLSELLFSLGSHGLFMAMQAASSVKAWESAQAAIVSRLANVGQPVKSFALGGFVPPGVTMLAKLHGPETIIPGDHRGQAYVTNHVTFEIKAWDGADVRRVVRDQVIPELNVALRLNSGFFASTIRQTV